MAYIVGSFYNASTFSKRKGRIIRGAFKSYSSSFNDSSGKSHIGYTCIHTTTWFNEFIVCLCMYRANWLFYKSCTVLASHVCLCF